jgi:hypothetical protein
VAAYVIPVNIIPRSRLNLADASWFHPVTYLISAYLLGLFVALMACGVIGLLFRVLPASRVRNVVLWVQVGFFILIQGSGPLLQGRGGMANRLNIADSPAMPLNWFAALAAPGSIQSLGTWPAVASMIGCVAFIALGIQSLSSGYLHASTLFFGAGHRIAGLDADCLERWRGSSSENQPGEAGCRSFTQWPGQTGSSAAHFTQYSSRSWYCRRSWSDGAGWETLLFNLELQLRRNFASHRRIARLPLCFGITASNQHRAAWIFLTFPSDSIRPFVRGIYCSLWILLNALSVLLCLLRVSLGFRRRRIVHCL